MGRSAYFRLRRALHGGPAIPEILHVPIFPLPNVVFFPQTILPLHVFEPRYRRLVNDVLGGDRRFAVFLLKPGEGRDALGAPAPFEFGCLGEIVRADALPDGRFNLLLIGLVRIRIQEFLSDVPYRMVGATLVPEGGGGELDAAGGGDFRGLVRRYFRGVLGRRTGPDLADQPLATLVNTAAANLETSVYERQGLLELESLPERMARVAELMTEQIEARRAIQLARSTRPPDPRVN
jgi:Lon protease-like protein